MRSHTKPLGTSPQLCKARHEPLQAGFGTHPVLMPVRARVVVECHDSQGFDLPAIDRLNASHLSVQLLQGQVIRAGEQAQELFPNDVASRDLVGKPAEQIRESRDGNHQAGQSYGQRRGLNQTPFLGCLWSEIPHQLSTGAALLHGALR